MDKKFRFINLKNIYIDVDKIVGFRESPNQLNENNEPYTEILLSGLDRIIVPVTLLEFIVILHVNGYYV